jgi:chromosome partitioning protein
MKVVAVYNNKGGVAKTVTTANLAYNLSAIGRRVLMVDMDPQGNLSAYYDRYNLNKNSVYDLLTGDKTSKRCRYRTKYDCLDIIPAHIRLANIESWKYDNQRFDLVIGLANFITEYDYVIIDCPPSVGWLMEQALGAANDVIIPVNPDRFSSDGLWTTLDIVDDATNGDLSDHIGVLFTRYRRNADTKDIVAKLVDMCGTEYFYENVIRDSSAVGHGIKVHKPLLKCSKRSTATQDYLDFTEEFLKRVGDEHEAE